MKIQPARVRSFVVLALLLFIRSELLACDPPPAGLISWWAGEANAYDSVGTNNGTFKGNLTFASGEVGQAFAFDGSTAYVLIPNANTFNTITNNLTIEFWMKCGVTVNNSDSTWLVTKGTGSWHVSGTAGGNSVTFSTPGTSQGDLSGTRNVNDAQWHHVAAIYDGHTKSLYVDGTLDVSVPCTGSVTRDSDPLELGSIPQAAGIPFNGFLDEVSIYQRALSVTEVQQIYAAGSQGKCESLPVIVSQPINQIVAVGGTVSFSVSATSVMPLAYQWSYGTTNISLATNATLALTNVQLSQAGNYSVIVSNQFGATNSATAVLTVYLAGLCDPSPSGIIGWWSGEADATDSIGADNGTLVGGTAFTSGEVGQAFLFNGSDYVSISNSATFNTITTNLTIEFWMKSALTGNNPGWMWAVTKGNNSWRVQGTSGGKSVTFSTTTDLLGTRNVNDGQWHHVAAVYDGTKMYLYVDGTLDVSQPASGSIPQNIQPVELGANSETISAFQGALDEVSLYQRALSPVEIQQIYVAGSQGKCGTAPVIVSQPTNQTVNAGTTAVLSASVTGALPLAYQWMLNNTNLPGATNATLILLNVQLSQAGNYSVTITNQFGSTNSVIAILTVNFVPCDPSPSGIIGWWPGEANANDTLGLNNGTLVGGATFTNGEAGQAFLFNGSDYVSIPNSATFNTMTTNLTVEFWMKSAITGNNPGWMWAVTKGNTSWRVMGTSAGKSVTFSAVMDMSGARNVNDGQWHHVAAVYDGAKMYLYVDGTLDASHSASGSVPQNTAPVELGANSETVSAFQGALDEVSIYQRALSATEIQQIYAAGSSGKCVIPPAIVSQPTNQTVLVGDHASFSVNAISTVPLVYQWTLNATNLPGATNAALILTNIQLSQAGNYSVTITNILGSLVSSNAVLTVNPRLCDPSPSGIISWWAGEASASDNIGANHGTLVGGTIFTNGEVGQAFLFNGSDFVSIPDSPSLDSVATNLTIEFWMKSAVTGGNPNWMWAVTKGNNSWRVQGTSLANTMSFDVNGINSQVDLTGTRNVNDGLWHHIAAVYDGTNKYLYVDSTLDVSQPASGLLPQNTEPVEIGANSQTSSAFQGALDEVSIYQRALNAAEIQQIYIASFQGKCGAPPIIVSQPTNQMVETGATLVFSVSATGAIPLMYQWTLNATNLLGATNATLILTNIQPGQAGNYSVTVTNPLGSAISSNALLTITTFVPPVINSFTPVAGIPGTNVTLTGLNFSPTASNNIVYFGAVQATVVSAAATQLVVTVPVGATYAPITETVNGLTAYASQAFLPAFLGNGANLALTNFAARLDLSGAPGSFSVAVVDMDGDGKPDLVVTAYGSSVVSVFRNISTNGPLSAASFAPRVNLATPPSGLNPFAAAVADLDGDGKLDIVVTDNGTGQISVYRNTSTPGNLSFGARIDFTVGSQPQGIAIQDLDGDGRPDLIVANGGDGTLSVFRNTSVPGALTVDSFAPPIVITTDPGCNFVVAGDLDGDGLPDLATANFNTNTISLLRNLSTPGNLAFAPKVDLAIPGQPQELTLGDLDGDGKPEIIAASYTSAVVSVFRNLSTNGTLAVSSFAPRIDFPLGGWGHNAALGDLNGDGQPDLALVSESTNVLSVFQNLSTPGAFTNSSLGPRLDFSTGSNPWNVTIGDLNGDGRPEIIFANQTSGTLSIYQNQTPFGGAPSFISQPANQTVNVGTTAVLSVSANGTVPLAYQWMLNNINLPGATNATLILPNVQLSQTGNYSVTVTNQLGVTNSAIAVLTVHVVTCDPPPSGIISWWAGEANAIDTIDANHGTWVNGTAFTNGEVGQAFLFNGNDNVTIPDSPTLDSITTNITIEFWMKSALTGNNPGFMWTVTKGNTSWRVGGTSRAKTMSFDVTGINTQVDLTGTRIVNDGQWHHVAAVYDGAHKYLYVDGTLDASQSASGSIPQNTQPVELGANSQASLAFVGALDEISLYQRALSAAEIQQIYAASFLGKCGTPPFIVFQPANQTDTVSNNANFSVSATGTAPLAYQWMLGNTNLPDATNATLVLTNVQLSQAGNYSVTITNQLGATNSAIAVLTVNPKLCDPTPAGIISWWAGEANANDSIGTNNGTLVGGPTFTNGEFGQAFFFNGSDFVSVPDSATFNPITTNLTIEFWMQSALTGGNPGWMWLVTKGNTSWRVMGTTGGKSVTFSSSGTSQADMLGTRNVNDGQWHHIAAVYDGAHKYLYVDGALDVSAACSGSISRNTEPVELGANSQTVSAFQGALDEVSIYQRALSAAEIQQVYVAGSLGKCGTPPVIVSQPANQTLKVGNSATFGVTATGAVPLYYQWYLTATNNPLSGATNSTLSLTNVQLTDAGVYFMTVANYLGSTVSSNALFTVYAQDHFLWNNIVSPRFVNTPFAVAIQAQDVSNAIVTNFTGTVILSSTNGVPVNPPVSANFTQGIWTGTLTIAQPVTNLVLRADDGLGEFGLANAMNVVNPPALAVQVGASSLTISWPVATPTFVLESSASLSPAQWTQVVPDPVQVNGQNIQSLSLSQTNCFYRLRYSGP